MDAKRFTPRHIIIKMLKVKDKEQEIVNPSEKIVKENFPYLVKEKKHASPGSTESPNYDGCKEAHCKTHRN